MRRSRAAAAPVSVTQISLFERCPSLPSAPDDDSGIGPQGRQGHSEPLRFARSFRGSLAPLHSGHELRPLCCERALRTEQLQGVNVGTRDRRSRSSGLRSITPRARRLSIQ